MTKEEFKELWEDPKSVVTFDQVAEVAVEWGLYKRPKLFPIDDILNAVLEAAGISEYDEIDEFDSRLNSLLQEFEHLPKEELIESLEFYINVLKNK